MTMSNPVYDANHRLTADVYDPQRFVRVRIVVDGKSFFRTVRVLKNTRTVAGREMLFGKRVLNDGTDWSKETAAHVEEELVGFVEADIVKELRLSLHYGELVEVQ